LSEVNSCTSSPRRLSREDWAVQLTERFFPIRKTPGPVHFAVDDQALDEIAGTDHGGGAISLARAVRPRLRRDDPRRLFDDITTSGFIWAANGHRGPPPFLPCLALCVLAASRMDASESVSSNNYYTRLRTALDIDCSAALGYPDAIPSMFRLLGEWLLNVERGRRGRSTIPENPSPAHIGYALSQVHIRESDRRKLTRFFALLRLRPADAGSADLLVAALRKWARGSDLSAGAKAFVASDEHRRAVAALIASELREWDETERDEHGQLLGRVQLLLEIKGSPRWGLLATRPDGFPEAATFASGDGSSLELHSSIDGFYDPVWFEEADSGLLGRALESPLLLRSGRVGLRFVVEPVTALGPDPRTGRLASVRRVEPGERHWVLARVGERDAVVALLADIAREGWSEARGAPSGWLLLRDVIVDLPPMSIVVADYLLTLVPAVDARPELSGGLLLERRGDVPTYLRGGEPDLWIPDWLADSETLRVRLDAQELTTSGATRMELSRLAPGPGVHVVEIGGATLRFRSVDGIATEPPTLAEACRIIVRPTTGDTVSVPLTGVPEGQWVCGAIASAGLDVADDDPVPVLLPYGARRYVLVGTEIGKVAECREPGRPGWLEEVGVLPQDFEVFPTFDAAWILIDWAYRGWEIRQGKESEPLDAGADVDRAVQWARALVVDGRVESPGQEVAWLAYRERAISILGNGVS